jgi:hypothetical protein
MNADDRRATEVAGLDADPVIETYKKDIDRTLLRENLRRPVEERVRNLARLQRFVAELRRAGPGTG